LNLKIFRISELNDIDRKQVDEFILHTLSNGEFINTTNYLAYHPQDRFIDDSIVINDVHTKKIKTVFMAAARPNDKETIISHPGTTFAGPIFMINQSIREIDVLLQHILSYYKNRYKTIILKTQPTIYTTQPSEEIAYLLLKHGFKAGFNAISNVIDLAKRSTEADLMATYNTSRRASVRSFQRKYKFKIVKDKKVSEQIWTHLIKNLQYKYNVSSTHSLSEINELIDKFPESILPYSIYLESKYAAFALIYRFKNIMHSQYLDVNYELVSRRPNIYLIHKILQLAVNEKSKYFSFGSSTEDNGNFINEGLMDFKNSFGGGRILMPVFTKYL
jgi:hypothetical protein